MKYIFMAMMVFVSVSVLSSRTQALETVEAPYDARLTDYAYPFATRNFELASQNKTLEMMYMWLPGDEDKPVVVLLHGKNFNGAYWQQTAEYLSSEGYGVLIPDQIGFGKSSKPTDYQYSFAALANNTRELMKSLKIKRAIMVGHSMGGMLATRFALNHPASTEKLILINPIGLENYLHYVEYRDVAFFYNIEKNLTPEGIEAYQRKNYYDGKWSDRYAELTEPLKGWVLGPDWPQLAMVNALTYDMIFTQPVVEELDDLAVPAALILGTRDRTGPGRGWKKAGVDYELGRYDRLGEQVRQRNSRIDLYQLDGLGHLPQIEDFDRFKAVFNQAMSAP